MCHCEDIVFFVVVGVEVGMEPKQLERPRKHVAIELIPKRTLAFHLVRRGLK